MNTSDKQQASQPGAPAPVDFMQRFVASRQFQQVFEEGMRLVEETADYLDGPGREQARSMSRDAAMAYATESMRLTTRLMQLASWLLLQRAVAAGELSEQDARQELENIDLASLARTIDSQAEQLLPEELTALARRGQQLYERIVKLDGMIRSRATPPAARERQNPLAGMLDRIASEFSASGKSSSGGNDGK